MISYDEAINIINNTPKNMARQKLPLHEALGKIAAQSVLSPLNLPAFDNSAMDGYALHSAHTQTARKDHPLILPVKGAQFAGEKPLSFDGAVAMKIMTGAPILAPFDTVLVVEKARLNDQGELIIDEPIAPDLNVRRFGQDVRLGDILIDKGCRISAQYILLLAAAGIDQIEVISTPFLTIYSTGDELNDLGTALSGPSHIYNASAPYLCAKAKEAGLEHRYGGLIIDDKEKLSRAFRDAPAASLVITTGSVSMGDKDFIPSVLTNLGAEILFHKVAIKPGKPILMARLPNQTVVFCMPGNPVSSVVGWMMFVVPYLHHILSAASPPKIMARLSHSFDNKSNLTLFLKARLSLSPELGAVATIMDGQESFKTKSLAESDGFVLIPHDTPSLKQGDLISFTPH